MLSWPCFPYAALRLHASAKALGTYSDPTSGVIPTMVEWCLGTLVPCGTVDMVFLREITQDTGRIFGKPHIIVEP